MKKASLLISLTCLIAFFTQAQEEEKYTVEVEVNGLKDTAVYMAYYYGKGQYYRDTAYFNEKGIAVFSKNDSLEHGMYSIFLKKAKLFDFMVDVQELSFKTDTSNYVGRMEVKGGNENKIFFDYLKYLNEQQVVATNLRNKLKSADEKEKKKIEEELLSLDKQVKKYISNLHEKHQGTLTSNFIRALDYPEVPEAPKNEDGTIDSTFEYKYFKAHFFDNIDFTDGRLVRTSVFHERIDYYLDKLTYQNTDSIIKSVDYILEKSSASPELFRYSLSYLTSKYERSERMGMDALFVHLGKNYFMKGKAKPWFSDKQLEKLTERVEALEPLLIGKKAPNIVVKDTAMKQFLQLYDIKAKYTIVYIWSPECGHCKKATPKLRDLYHKVKDQGVEVFAVGNEFENEEWLRFIQKHKLDWINGSDGNDFTSNFRTLYDVYSTPQTYLLDEDKKILAKKISIEALEDILNYYMEKDKKAPENSDEK
tara:strand:- start:3314 stop:4750 length:1437 start_codon:yes stop_codon:yes gene_type:complete